MFSVHFNRLPLSVQGIVKILVEKSNPKKVILFGSRAKQNFRNNSDFDIAVVGRICDEKTWNKILIAIEEDPLSLQTVEVVEYEKLQNPYKEAIDKEGVVLWTI